MQVEDYHLLPEAEQDRYMKLERLFMSEGWQLISEWAEAKAQEIILRQANASSWDDHNALRGARLVYTEISNLDEVTEREFAAVVDTIKEQQALDDEIEFE